MIDIKAVQEPVNAVKIPSTPIIDTRTNTLAREWLYFFNEIGNVVDQAIAANLTEMTISILESADTAELSLYAPQPPHPIAVDYIDQVSVSNSEYGANELLSHIDIPTAYTLKSLQDKVSGSDTATANKLTAIDDKVTAIDDKLKEIELWQLLTPSL